MDKQSDLLSNYVAKAVINNSGINISPDAEMSILVNCHTVAFWELVHNLTWSHLTLCIDREFKCIYNLYVYYHNV
jgi:hypothetical protein